MSVRSPLFPFGVLELQGPVLAPHPPSALLMVRAVVFIFPSHAKCAPGNVLMTALDWLSLAPGAETLERGCMQHVTLGKEI